MAAEAQKFDFIINRRSGTVMHVGEDQVREELLKTFGDRAGTITFVEGQDVASSIQGWIANNAGGDRGIIVGGGDGTVLTAATEVMGKEGVTLGVLPMGTQNLFARRLGFSADFKKAAAQYADSQACSVDVGVINGMYFLVALALDGNSVKFFEARESLRDKDIVDAVTTGLPLAFARSEKLTVKEGANDAAVLKGKVFTVTANPLHPRPNKGNMHKGMMLDTDALKEIGGNMLAQGKEAEGKLALYVVSPGPLDGLSLINSVREGTWLEHDAVTSQTGTEFVIAPQKGADAERKIILDGEIKKTSSTMHIGLIPKALKVFRPK